MPDILSFLLEPWKDRTPTGSDLNFLQGDNQLIVVAGRSEFSQIPSTSICHGLTSISDTTASTLASIFYELVRLPDRIATLKDAIRGLLLSGEKLSHESLQNLHELNAVIDETLRLHPPAGLLLRKTPPEGLTIGDFFVPGNVTVFCPHWVAGRSELTSKNPYLRDSTDSLPLIGEKSYVDASTFRPERWSEGSDMIKEPSAYAPFSTGRLLFSRPSPAPFARTNNSSPNSPCNSIIDATPLV